MIRFLLARHGETDWSMFTIRMINQTSRWRNAVALSWTTEGSPVKVALQEAQNTWTFSVDSRIVEFDWVTGEATQR